VPYPLASTALKLLVPLLTIVLVGWCAGRLLVRRRAQSKAGTR
jgi:hypothetical protein